MLIEDFKYRYFLITKSDLRNQKSKIIGLVGDKIYNKYVHILSTEKSFKRFDSVVMLVDLKILKVLAIFNTSDKSYLINMEHFDLSGIKKFKVKNTLAYNQNIIRMSSIENRIVDTYAIGGVWSIIHYVTVKNKHRILVNKNIFGNISLFKTRDYKIHKLLED